MRYIAHGLWASITGGDCCCARAHAPIIVLCDGERELVVVLLEALVVDKESRRVELTHHLNLLDKLLRSHNIRLRIGEPPRQKQHNARATTSTSTPHHEAMLILHAYTVLEHSIPAHDKTRFGTSCSAYNSLERAALRYCVPLLTAFATEVNSRSHGGTQQSDFGPMCRLDQQRVRRHNRGLGSPS